MGFCRVELEASTSPDATIYNDYSKDWQKNFLTTSSDHNYHDAYAIASP